MLLQVKDCSHREDGSGDPSSAVDQIPALEMCSREPQLLADLLPDVLARYLQSPRAAGKSGPRRETGSSTRRWADASW